MRASASPQRARQAARLCALVFCSAILTVSGARSQTSPGATDLSFDPGAGPNAVVRAVALEPDGRVLIGGAFGSVGPANRTAVARLTADGEVDESFGVAGLTGDVRAIVRQPDGRILIGGNFSTPGGIRCIARLNSDGTLDATFNPGTGANNVVWSVALQGDGKILIAGDFTQVNGTPRTSLARLTSTGDLDPAFNATLTINGPARVVRLLPDGAIMIGGNFTAIDGARRHRIARISPDGRLDAGFDPGDGADSWVSAITVQGDGRILVGGGFTSVGGVPRTRIARLHADGRIDQSFDPGLGANDAVTSIVLEEDGKIILGGGFTGVDGMLRRRVARLYPDGLVDPFFAPDPGANDWVEAVTLQPDGRILIGGDFFQVNQTPRVRVARLFGGDPPPTAPVASGTTANVTIEEGSDFILGAGMRGSPEPTYRWFKDGVEIAGANRDTLRLRNLRAGSAGNYTVTATNALGSAERPVAIITVVPAPREPGAPDLDFYAGSGPDAAVHAIAEQYDDQLLIGGAFTSVDGLAHTAVARLRADGMIDQSFHSAVGGVVRALAIPPDGRILVAGAFRQADNPTLMLAARLNSDGSLDPTFRPAAGSGFASEILALPNQQVLVGGPLEIATDAGPRIALARLNADGTVDAGFDLGFLPGAAVYAMSLQPNRQVIIGGFFSTVGGAPRPNLARIREDGTLDPTFDPGSGPNGSVRAMALQRDGKLIVAGRFTRFAGFARTRIARVNSDGSLDPTFDAGTLAEADEITSLAVQGDGKILFGTTFNDGEFAIARLNPDGSLDGSFRTVPFPNRPSFGPSGAVEAIKVLRNADVLVGGRFERVNNTARRNLARLLAGDPPPAAPTLVREPAARTVAAGSDVTLEVVVSSNPLPSYQWQFNGVDLPGETRAFLTLRNVRESSRGAYRVIVSNALGTATSAAATLDVLPPRSNPGAPDVGFYAGLGPNDVVHAVAIQPDGKIVISGMFTEVSGTRRNRVARLNRDGSVDTSFNPGTGANNVVNALSIQPDGKIVIGGSFTSFDDLPRNRVARLNSDGSLDLTFAASAGADRQVLAIALQPNGSIVIGGTFTTVNGTPQSGIARLTSAGALDATFVSPLGPNATVAAIALQPDEGILVGGLFTYGDGTLRNLARILPSGAIDPAFVTGSGPSHRVDAIAVESDGQILIGGLFINYGASVRPNLARLDGNGSLDSTFAPAVNGPVAAIAVQADATIVIGGGFSDVGHVVRSRLARLNPDGSLNAAFDVGTGVEGGAAAIDEYGEYGDIRQRAFVSGIALEGQNTAIVVGNFTSVAEAARPFVARVFLRNAAGIDNDGDGLPDQWEQQFGFDPYDAGGINGGSGDIDGDARTNRTEFINGTNPLRGDSSEPQITITQVAPGVRALRFPTLPGRTYRIFYTLDLTQPFLPIDPPIAGTGSEVSWTDDGSKTGGAGVPNRFYKLEVELSPVP